jgi:hypothetical protein
LRHTRKHKTGKKESNQEAKHTGSGGPSGQEGRTIRTGHADRPACCRGPSAPTPRTVHTNTADCPALRRGPSDKTHRTSRDAPRITNRPRGARRLSARHPRTVRPAHADRPKLRPTKTQNHDGSKRKASKNMKNTRRTRAARTVRQDDADRPRDTDRAEKQPDLEGQLPQIIIGFPKRLKL